MPSFYSLSEDSQRLLKGLVFSILFHTVLVLGLGGVSMIFVESPSSRVGPISVSIGPVPHPDETIENGEPVETLPEEPAETLPDETEPEIPEIETEPEELPEVEPEPLPDPDAEPEPLPVTEPEPDDLPEPDLSLEPELEIPDSSPGERPSDEDSPAPVEAVQAGASPEPVGTTGTETRESDSVSESLTASGGSSYEGSTEIPEAYAGLLAAPREAEENTGGRSGEELTAPEETPTWEGTGSEVYSSDTSLTVVEQPTGGSSGSSDEAENGDEAREGDTITNLDALDEAISRISDGEDEGVYIVNESETGITASVPGNAGENTSQISFLDGEGRVLKYSEPPEIPPSLRSIGLPEYIVTVYFSVTPEGAVRDLKIDPSSGNNELDAAIRLSVRNWVFTSSGDAGNVQARVQFLIKVK